MLHGQTKGYRHHPQLQRFQAHAAPLDAMRNLALHAQWRDAAFGVHPLFRSVPGPVAAWERP